MLDGYITRSTKNFTLAVKIVLIVLVLFGGIVLGYWFGGGFTDQPETMRDTQFESYIDANIDRLKFELECITEQNLRDLEALEVLTEHINQQTIQLNQRFEKVIEYKEVLDEAETVIDDVNHNLDRYRPRN